MYISSSNNCGSCIYKDVCKYEKYVRNIYMDDNAGDIEKIIAIDISCKLYEKRHQTLVADRKG